MFHSKPPRRAGDLPYWDFVSLQSGERWKGWLAGPVVGVEVHYTGASKACRASITEGKLLCSFCASNLSSVWRGYVPLWDEHGIRCVSVVGERYADLAQSIPHLAPVCVTKLKRQGSPIRVEAFAWSSQLPPLSRADQRPQDLRRWLVRLWGDAELQNYFSENPIADAPIEMPAAVPTTPPELRSVPPKPKPSSKPQAGAGEVEECADPRTIKALLAKSPLLNGHKKGK